MKRKLLSALLRANRPELANAVAYRVSGKIQLPPRRIIPYVSRQLQRIKKLAADATKLQERFQLLEQPHDGTIPFEDFDPEVRGALGSDITGVLYWLAQHRDYGVNGRLNQIHYRVEVAFNVLKHETDNAYQYLEDVKNLAQGYSYAAHGLKNLLDRRAWKVLHEQDWVDESYDAYVRYIMTDQKGVPWMEKRDLLDFKRLLQQTYRLYDELKEAESRLMVAHDTPHQMHRDPQWKPPSEKTETLYHASIDANTIFRRGFDPKVPEKKGLGGSQGDKRGNPAISFTSDLYVAKEVMRGLKEAIMVANRKVKLRHVLDWGERAGVGDDMKRYWRRELHDYNNKPKYPPDVTVMELYRLYMGLQKKRYNPYFFGDMKRLMKALRGRNHRDVGVLVCSVDMQNPDILYMTTMQEYRVPPASVVSIDKLIR